MKRKPIKVDWDELEAAFENKREDLVYYLDLVTGQVVLDGEGEEAEFQDEESDEDELVVRDDAARLYVEPPSPDDELGWMTDFVEESGVVDGELQESLNEVLDTGSPDAFRDALRHHAEVRDKWFGYRSDRLHEAIDAWLDANSVNALEPPPWR